MADNLTECEKIELSIRRFCAEPLKGDEPSWFRIALLELANQIAHDDYERRVGLKP